MNSLHPPAGLAPFAIALVLASGSAAAFTDSNADIKDSVSERTARPAAPARAAPPVRAAWVPTPAKRLDGFKPVLPPDGRGTAVARADAASAPR